MGAPVKHTCPDIDKCINAVQEVLAVVKEGLRNNEKNDDNWDRFNDIENLLCFTESELEILRKSNSSLREWGEECEERIEALESKNESMQKRFDEFEMQSAAS